MEENKIKPEDIEEISIKGQPAMLTPNRAGTEIKGFADTQFSHAYIFALVPYYGSKPGPDGQVPSTFNDPKIRGLMRKVKVGLHPKAAELIASRLKEGEAPRFPDTVAEITAGGRRFTAEVAVSKGAPANPITDQELEEKFRGNAQYSILRTDKCEKAIEMIYELERVDEIAKLFDPLTLE